MTEILFILTTIYVAYVVYSIINGQKTSLASPKPEIQIQAEVKQAKPEIIVERKERPVTIRKNAVKAPVVTEKPVVAAKGSVRDPITGEVATVTANYRFTKRWIKEALVTEGLLDKVYKNNELDAAAETAIKTALVAFMEMGKYRA
ncbi:hypothetical protein [Methylovulum miyakonense]|uniref:hypothetical protein n=1 Tax=Methylovulum miyakonense TaxID=645578 RepID=UPI00037BAE77|nr:hypothetical protein [Methylovulum miyakonense]